MKIIIIYRYSNLLFWTPVFLQCQVHLHLIILVAINSSLELPISLFGCISMSILQSLTFILVDQEMRA